MEQKPDAYEPDNLLRYHMALSFVDQLEAEGFLYTVAGKGCFVAEKNLDLVREQQLKDLEAHLAAAAELAKSCGVSREELHEMLRILLEEEER